MEYKNSVLKKLSKWPGQRSLPGGIGQAVDNRLIRGEERHFGKILGMDPTMLGNAEVAEQTGPKSADVSEDQYRTPSITIVNHLVDPVDTDLRAEFLVNLTDQGSFGAFPGVDLAAGELP